MPRRHSRPCVPPAGDVGLTQAARDALNHLCGMPNAATVTLDRPDFKSLLLHTGGRQLAQGVFRDVCHKHLGAGVFRVWLSKENADAT